MILLFAQYHNMKNMENDHVQNAQKYDPKKVSLLKRF